MQSVARNEILRSGRYEIYEGARREEGTKYGKVNNVRGHGKEKAQR